MTATRMPAQVAMACAVACAAAGSLVMVRLQAQPIAPMGVCRPIGERTADAPGCWIVTNQAIGAIAGREAYWHLDTFRTRTAADAARGPRGTIVEAFGKIWLFTIEDKEWRPAAGAHVASIGPLPVTPGTKYTAQYMEALQPPGMTSLVHRHPGPEAWYELSGETCLETPAGTSVARVGGPPVIVPGGVPMHLTSIGSETRRSLVLVLHDSQQPAGTEIHDWTPKGLCK